MRYCVFWVKPIYVLFLFLIPCKIFADFSHSTHLIDSIKCPGQSFTDDTTHTQLSIKKNIHENEIIKLTNNDPLEAIRLCIKSGHEYFEADQFDLAIDMYLKGLSIYDRFLDVPASNSIKLQGKETAILQGNLKYGIAEVYAKLQQHDFSLDFFRGAVAHYALAGEDSLQMEALNGLALSWFYLENYKEGMFYFNALLNIAHKVADSNMIAGACNNIGLVNIKTGDFVSAKTNFLRAAKIYNSIGETKKQAVAIYNLGFIQGQLGSYDSVVVYYLKVLKLLNNIGDHEGMVKAQLAIAQYYYSKGWFDKTEVFLFEALENANLAGANHFIIEIYQHLSALFAGQNRYAEAFSYQKTCQMMRDSMYHQSKENISALQLKYETKKREREKMLLRQENQIAELRLQKQENRLIYLIIISVLALLAVLVIYQKYRLKKKTNILLARQKQQLELINATKDKFFSIIAHDLKNPFYSIRNLSDVLYHDFKKLNEDQKARLIAGLNRSTGHISHLLENLLQWAMSQTGKLKINLSECSLTIIIQDEIKLARTHADKREITIKNSVSPGFFTYCDQQMLAFVIRNLLSNAIKFSNRGSLVIISAIAHHETIQVCIRDQGQGISRENISKLFRIDENPSTIPASGQKGSGLGLILCKDFITRNNGKISVESTPGKGSMFTFTLPILLEDEKNQGFSG